MQRIAPAMYRRLAPEIATAHARTGESSARLKGTQMPEPQTYKNHTRFDPVFHYFILPVLLLNIFFSIAATIHHWPNHRVLFCWWILLSVVLFMAVGTARGHSLKAQDRIIRLEERLRMAALLSPGRVHPQQGAHRVSVDSPALRG